MLQIKWSPLAVESYLTTIEFIRVKWSNKTVLDFEEKVEKLLERLSKFQQLCPPADKYPMLRKCVISKQTSLVYEIKDNEIEIVTFYDNRSGFKY